MRFLDGRQHRPARLDRTAWLSLRVSVLKLLTNIDALAAPWQLEHATETEAFRDVQYQYRRYFQTLHEVIRISMQHRVLNIDLQLGVLELDPHLITKLEL